MNLTNDDKKNAEDAKRISDEAVRWVVRLHSGEASPADRKKLANWRIEDARNENAFLEAEKVWAATSGLRLDIKTGKARAEGKRKRSRSPKISIAFAASLGLATGALLWQFYGTRHDVTTGIAEIRTITLPDGSKATLNAHAALDLNYGSDARKIKLIKGEAFFEVARDPRRPFQVETSDAVITALGTSFNVKSRIALKETDIAVIQHAVEVESTNGNQAKQPVRVQENYQVVVRSGEIGSAAPAQIDTVLSWRKGLLISEGKPLANVVEDLKAYHKGWILISQGAEKIPVSAVLDLRNPDGSLDALAAALPIIVRRLSPYVVLVMAR